NYRQVVSESDDILTFLMKNGGVFPEDMFRRSDDFDLGRGDPSRADPDMEWEFEETWEFNPPPDFAERRSFMQIDERRTESAELAAETRYFSVLLSENGEVLRTDTSFISAISKSTAEKYAVKALRQHGSTGFIGDYRYLVGSPDASGNRLVIFRDCGASLANFRNFRNISIFVSLLCLLLVGVMVFFASGHIVRPVAESYEKQKRFITDAGHEIKTPLAIITADTEVLEMELGDADAGGMDSDAQSDGTSENEWLADIRLQTKRLSELTQDLITLSKMEESSTVLEMKDLDLSQMVRTHAGSFAAVATAADKTISSKIEDDVHIQGDKKSIDSLLSILLDNAVKYCPENGHVDIRVRKSRKGAVVEVSNDTQEEFSSETCKNMFERFYRTDASRNSGTGGHGIGLSIARAIVEKHKGRISAAPGEGRKLTITVLLPR
ncbi:MAG: HAMP domain-containing histidine kinase, partial [Clostridiales bacterium]|nr:HAMP domain-containing histidine kinase [Clostridiales bacterium]